MLQQESQWGWMSAFKHRLFMDYGLVSAVDQLLRVCNKPYCLVNSVRGPDRNRQEKGAWCRKSQPFTQSGGWLESKAYREVGNQILNRAYARFTIPCIVDEDDLLRIKLRQDWRAVLRMQARLENLKQ